MHHWEWANYSIFRKFQKMDEALKGKITRLNLHNRLIMDLLESIEPRHLSLKPIDNAGTFGKQFRHILDVRRCYRDALLSGKLDFFRDDIDHSIENNKAALIRGMHESIDSIIESIKSLTTLELNERKIDCISSVKYLGEHYTMINPLETLDLLVDHEVFHQGEFAIYLRSAGIVFPKSWMFWGLVK